MQVKSVFMHPATENPHIGTTSYLHPHFISLRTMYKQELDISFVSNSKVVLNLMRS